jgi:hypothetical protein
MEDVDDPAGPVVVYDERHLLGGGDRLGGDQPPLDRGFPVRGIDLVNALHIDRQGQRQVCVSSLRSSQRHRSRRHRQLGDPTFAGRMRRAGSERPVLAPS